MAEQGTEGTLEGLTWDQLPQARASCRASKPHVGPASTGSGQLQDPATPCETSFCRLGPAAGPSKPHVGPASADSGQLWGTARVWLEQECARSLHCSAGIVLIMARLLLSQGEVFGSPYRLAVPSELRRPLPYWKQSWAQFKQWESSRQHKPTVSGTQD